MGRGGPLEGVHARVRDPGVDGPVLRRQLTGREPAEELVEPLSWTIWEGIRERSALDYLLARTELGVFSRHRRALEDLRRDPEACARPTAAADRRDRRLQREPWDDFTPQRFTPYTAIFNVTGQPAISLPLFHGDDGLPPAVQLGGRPPGEADLLRLAAQLEAARPWAHRRPEQAAPGDPHA